MESGRFNSKTTSTKNYSLPWPAKTKSQLKPENYNERSLQQSLPPRLVPRRLGHRQAQKLRDLPEVVDAPEAFGCARLWVGAHHPREPKRAGVERGVGQLEEEGLACCCCRGLEDCGGGRGGVLVSVSRGGGSWWRGCMDVYMAVKGERIHHMSADGDL